MDAASFSSEFPSEPVIQQEGRFFRVSVLRRSRVESYLCESETQARHFAQLLAQPPSDPRPRPQPAKPPARKATLPSPRLSVIPTVPMSWKGPR